MREFIAFTNTGEKTAIYCLSEHQWRLDVASDNYFQHPEQYYREAKPAVDRRALEKLFNRYKGIQIVRSVSVSSLSSDEV